MTNLKKNIQKDKRESTYSKAYKTILNADQKTYDAYLFGKYSERRRLKNDSKIGSPLVDRAERRLSKNRYREEQVSV